MSELAKTNITISDESAYPAGISSIIPLYVFATEQDKIIDENTGEIALGTSKAVANKLMLLTSQTDVINTYGTPKYTVIDGTVQQGDELNESGLYGLYDALGSASLAYALRADIDLKQLKPTQVEPISNVKNGTKWVDLKSSSYGVFRANGNKRPALAWDNVDVLGVYEAVKPTEDETVIEATLKNVMGSDGDIVIVKEGTKLTFCERVTNKETYVDEWAIIDGNEDSVWSNAKSYINDEETVVPTVTHSTHTKVPSGLVKGSIWFKTTTPNNGSNIVLKTYKESANDWEVSSMPVFGSYIKAEEQLSSNLVNGSLVVKYDDDAEGVYYIAEYNSNGIVKAEQTVELTEEQIRDLFVAGNSITITTLVNGHEKTSDALIIPEREMTLTVFSKMINAYKIEGIMAIVDENGKLVIMNTNGHAFKLKDTNGQTFADLGMIVDAEYSNWYVSSVVCQEIEPSNEASFGTYWFNDEFNVDIMVNDGKHWLGYRNMYENANIYVQSNDPMESNVELHDYDLWVDTNASDYPHINRYFDGEWELVDNTDQTTSMGVIFADVREDAGYVKDNSKSQEALLTSNYVDPNAPEPQAYSEGILLFNTLFSTNNVKVYANTYENAVKEMGETYCVGVEEDEFTFAMPGSHLNPKTTRWATISGNKENGAGYFGAEAQRIMIVRALQEAIKSNDEIRSNEYDFFYACCPGYPEVDDELIALNADKKEMFLIVADTPSKLAPKAQEIVAWGSNANNATTQGADGRTMKNAYVTRTYPSMGLTSNVDGMNIAVPTSVAKMKNLLLLPRGMAAAGTQYGQVTNLASVGYITDENEYAPVTIRDGLGEVICSQEINPIMPRRNTGLLLWGMQTENPVSSALSDETTILTLLRLKRELDEACLPFFFKPNIESVRNDFDATLRSILSDYVARNELYDFALVTDETVNTPETIERGELWANIAIEPTKFVKMIYIPIRVVRTGSLSE